MAFLLSPTGLLLITLALATAGAGVQTVRLSTCQAGAAEAQAALTVAGDRLKQQSAAVADWQAKAAQAARKGAQEHAKVVAVTQSHAALVASLKARVEAPAPVAVGGVEIGCREALSEVRGGK